MSQFIPDVGQGAEAGAKYASRVATNLGSNYGVGLPVYNQGVQLAQTANGFGSSAYNDLYNNDQAIGQMN